MIFFCDAPFLRVPTPTKKQNTVTMALLSLSLSLGIDSQLKFWLIMCFYSRKLLNKSGVWQQFIKSNDRGLFEHVEHLFTPSIF